MILECTPRGIRHLLQSRFPSESLLPPSLASSSVTRRLRRKKRLPIRRQRRPAPPPAHTHCLVNPSVPSLRSVSGRQSAAVVVLGVGGLPPQPAAGPLLSSICRSITMKGLYGPFCPGGQAGGSAACKCLVRSVVLRIGRQFETTTSCSPKERALDSANGPSMAH